MIRRILSKLKRQLLYGSILRQARNQSLSVIESRLPSNLLIICYGNIYRSPFVAAYLSKKLSRVQVNIKSAGFYPVPDRKSPDLHIQISRKYNVDLSSHASRILDKEMLEWSDMVVLMDLKNYLLLGEFTKYHPNKILWLGAFDDGYNVEIEDPYDKEPEQQEHIVSRMKTCCDNLAGLILINKTEN